MTDLVAYGGLFFVALLILSAFGAVEQAYEHHALRGEGRLERARRQAHPVGRAYRTR